MNHVVRSVEDFQLLHDHMWPSAGITGDHEQARILCIVLECGSTKYLGTLATLQMNKYLTGNTLEQCIDIKCTERLNHVAFKLFK